VASYRASIPAAFGHVEISPGTWAESGQISVGFSRASGPVPAEDTLGDTARSPQGRSLALILDHGAPEDGAEFCELQEVKFSPDRGPWEDNGEESRGLAIASTSSTIST
jgi:hypothetical protein